jgi:hypothetical protein
MQALHRPNIGGDNFAGWSSLGSTHQIGVHVFCHEHFAPHTKLRTGISLHVKALQQAGRFLDTNRRCNNITVAPFWPISFRLSETIGLLYRFGAPQH